MRFKIEEDQDSFIPGRTFILEFNSDNQRGKFFLTREELEQLKEEIDEAINRSFVIIE